MSDGAYDTTRTRLLAHPSPKQAYLRKAAARYTTCDAAHRYSDQGRSTTDAWLRGNFDVTAGA